MSNLSKNNNSTPKGFVVRIDRASPFSLEKIAHAFPVSQNGKVEREADNENPEVEPAETEKNVNK